MQHRPTITPLFDGYPVNHYCNTRLPVESPPNVEAEGRCRTCRTLGRRQTRRQHEAQKPGTGGVPSSDLFSVDLLTSAIADKPGSPPAYSARSIYLYQSSHWGSPSGPFLRNLRPSLQSGSGIVLPFIGFPAMVWSHSWIVISAESPPFRIFCSILGLHTQPFSFPARPCDPISLFVTTRVWLPSSTGSCLGMSYTPSLRGCG